MALFEAPRPQKVLADDYIVNPFSVLRKVADKWRTRKIYWDNMNIEGTVGRDTKRYNAVPYNMYGSREECQNYEQSEHISTFDPVLCEIMYKWFSKERDTILDPFAGGSTRGIIASILGRNYIGIDLSQRQVLANQKQYQTISEKEGTAIWITGDSEYALDEIEDGTCQMMFTCPPYYNLEQYTRDVRDLSRQATYDGFLIKYTSILEKAVAKLDMNAGAFAVIVVSEIRNFKSGGEFYGLVPDTINIFRNAGLHYYNEIILEDPIGSLPIRGPQYFQQSRKIGRHHQNVLVFYAGDLLKIREKCDSLNK